VNEIVVISGKGGTGKTSITAALAMIGGERLVMADCDVDAADLHLLLHPEAIDRKPFFGNKKAFINQHECIGCGQCQDVCHFDAVVFETNHYLISQLECEGCGYCKRICPANAIIMKPVVSGETCISRSKTGGLMVHASLGIGADNSGKLVTEVKNTARKIARDKHLDTILIDGSPGIGCPVVSSLAGATYTLLVTEPTLSGVHDLKRVFELVKRFRIPAGCVINKSDINPEQTTIIKQFLSDEGISLLAEIPYHPAFQQALRAGKTITEWHDGQLKDLVYHLWKQIQPLKETVPL